MSFPTKNRNIWISWRTNSACIDKIVEMCDIKRLWLNSDNVDMQTECLKFLFSEQKCVFGFHK